MSSSLPVKTDDSTSTSPKEVPTTEELAAFARSLRDLVNEKRAVVSAFERRVGQINADGAREACLALAKVAGEIIDEIPGAAIGYPRIVTREEKGRLFKKTVTEERHVKAILLIDPWHRPRHPGGGRETTHCQVILIDRDGRLYSYKDHLTYESPGEEALIKHGSLPIESRGALDANVHTRRFALHHMANSGEEMGDGIDASTWETITAYLGETIKATMERLQKEAATLDRKSETHGLPR